MFSYKMNRNIYKAYVRCAMLDNSEAWQVNIEDTYQLQQREMQMVRWMCSISLSERRPSEEMRGRLRIQNISVVMQHMHLRWFGHIERMENENWISKCRSLVADLAAEMGRPCKTWNEVVQNICKLCNWKKHSLKTVLERCHQGATVLPMLARNRC